MKRRNAIVEASSRPSDRPVATAAIQSAHAERPRSGRTEWVAIMRFYQQLIRISPTLATLTGHAAAVGEAKGPEVGLAALAGIDPDAVSGYQPYWAVALTCCSGWREHLRQRTLTTAQLA
jgi:predicted RNA polymerase sigma factor